MSVFIDRNGSIQRIHLGVMTARQIDSFIAELLK
jgi:hypothetical protein